MRLGVLLPHRAVVLQSARRPPLEVCWTVARLCDEAGLDRWVGDSVVAKPRLEPLTTLAYLAAMTQRARLGTAVLLPALRQPTVLAHTLANIDQMFHGRLVLGLGVGWGLPEIAREWEACGRIHKRRRHDLEEHIIVWRKLWSGQAVTYTGHDVKLTEHTIGPLPWHEAGPPILITAGNRGEIIPAQLDRFARLGDGIITNSAVPIFNRSLLVTIVRSPGTPQEHLQENVQAGGTADTNALFYADTDIKRGDEIQATHLDEPRVVTAVHLKTALSGELTHYEVELEPLSVYKERQATHDQWSTPRTL